MSVELLRSMYVAFGDEGMDRLLAERGKRLLATYRQRMPPPDAELGERVHALARLLDREGYRAKARKQPDGSWVLTEHHCPICTAARTCQGLCRDELALFRTLFGRTVEVEREQHIAAGDHHCVYRITPPA